MTLLFNYYCKKGNIQQVKMMIENDPSCLNYENHNGNNGWIIACIYGKTEIVKLIMENKNYDINQRSGRLEKAIEIACRRGHTEIVKLIVNDERFDCFHYYDYVNAARGGYTEIVKIIANTEKGLKRSFDLNQYCSYGFSGFSEACLYGRISTVKELLKHANTFVVINDDRYPNEIKKLLGDYLKNPIAYRQQLALEEIMFLYYDIIFFNENIFS